MNPTPLPKDICFKTLPPSMPKCAMAESIFHKFLDKEHPDLLICKNQRENVIGMDGQKVDLLEIENL